MRYLHGGRLSYFEGLSASTAINLSFSACFPFLSTETLSPFDSNGLMNSALAPGVLYCTVAVKISSISRSVRQPVDG